MVSIYQNANGETPCMPDGLQPDVTVEDNPMLPYQLGDVNEPLLQAALLRAGRKYENLSTRSHSQLPLYPSLPMPQKATFGKTDSPSSGGYKTFRHDNARYTISRHLPLSSSLDESGGGLSILTDKNPGKIFRITLR